MRNIKHTTLLIICLLASSLAFKPYNSLVIRGGDSDYDYDEYDSDVEAPTKLSSSAKKALEKAQTKKAKKSTKTVSKAMSSGIRIPYLFKVMLNPFTILTMIRGYFASLFNIDYLQEDVSQTLRSALQEKAKSTGGAKRQRKMKPGQAKTLSDLPQLSA
ncbi:hypothetical protein CTEN210_00330 [Chaetoceros tenuissimus]|uniref:Uncharacterized protein n=1 Tax=Chaetoceros tenuissimus TaxID=426638 RepID=A0AAD3CD37_9STRA|nr:hypothetical protein CTEN210_00330 [Chaetoceros tenuissimus]